MTLIESANALAGYIMPREIRVVFAESCTAGLVSASLARVPGISECLCGSAVTYRERTKQDWLKVAAEDVERFTAVSDPVARQMALGVLKATPEAHWSASVTGHLGPQSPEGLDGLIYVGIACREQAALECVNVLRVHLRANTRGRRQQEAAAEVLRALLEAIKIHA